MTASLRIVYDPHSLAWMSELNRLLRLLSESVEQPVDLIDLVSRFAGRGIGADLKLLAAGSANEQRIILEPSERLRALMSALRAWDGKGEFVLDRHDASSTQGADHSPSGEALKPPGAAQ